MAGGHYEQIAMDEAIVDGNIVSSPAWPSHPALLSKFLELLGTKIMHEEGAMA